MKSAGGSIPFGYRQVRVGTILYRPGERFWVNADLLYKATVVTIMDCYIYAAGLAHLKKIKQALFIAGQTQRLGTGRTTSPPILMTQDNNSPDKDHSRRSPQSPRPADSLAQMRGLGSTVGFLAAILVLACMKICELADYQKRLPDSADHARTSLVSSAGASGRCGVVLDVGGCSG